MKVAFDLAFPGRKGALCALKPAIVCDRKGKPRSICFSPGNVSQTFGWFEKCTYCQYISYSIDETALRGASPGPGVDKRGSIIDCKNAVVWLDSCGEIQPIATQQNWSVAREEGTTDRDAPWRR